MLDYLPKQIQVEPSLVHIDYWPGNILGYGNDLGGGRLGRSGAGDPGIDVAYCRMEITLSGMGEAAEQFLEI